MEYRTHIVLAATVIAWIALSSPALVHASSAEEMSLWQEAVSTGSPGDLQNFVARFPDSEFADEATSLLESLGEPVTVESQTRTADGAQNPARATTRAVTSATTGFEIPVVTDIQSDEPRSIRQLAEGTPLFAPVEGLPSEYWEAEVCSNCHNWDKAALCTQGEYYVKQENDVSQRINHPYGGFFKRALEQWASEGCQ